MNSRQYFNKKKIVSVLILSIAILLLSAVLVKEQNDTILTNANLSNKKIGWGIKRNQDHKQPDVGGINKKMLEENGGICLGNETKKAIYLTFDEGYEAGYTPKILNVLKNNEVKATFFLTAHFVNTQENLVKQMISDGHIIGNHTVNHKSMPDLSEEEIKKEIINLHDVLKEKFQYEMKFMRPPKGEFSERTLSITQSMGYKTVMWSFAYEDWNENKQPEESEAKKKIIDNLHPGEIMLLHGNSKTNTSILESIIKEARAQGYEFYPLDQFEK